ncbi:Clavaminate synthase-like protein [Hypoxylon sp. FL1284]|nr:Clavaminate synthase-like protein [Hypoxylon sp. FL1284]
MLPKLRLGSRLFSTLPSTYLSRCSGTSRFPRFHSTSPSIPVVDQSSNNGNSRIQHSASQAHGVETIVGGVEIDAFRKAAWIPQTPLLLQDFHSLPAMRRWFQDDVGSSLVKFAPFMKPFENIILPYEFTLPSPHSDKSSPEGLVLVDYLKWLRESSEYRESYLPVLVEAIMQLNNGADLLDNPSDFQQFDAPLSLIMSACQFNMTRGTSAGRLKRLYVAQSNLSNLPESLSRDLPTPEIVRYAGKGDIYSSSIWLGLQPTNTPLHRDPNPNLFCQLVSSKKIRVMTPDHGDALYARVRRELGTNGNSRIRGAEMMGGRERGLLHRAVWDDESVSEVLLHPGDTLFIPTGWWHSVVSDGMDGELNCSVNWWFR